MKTLMYLSILMFCITAACAQTWIEIQQDGKTYRVPAVLVDPNEIPDPNIPSDPNIPLEPNEPPVVATYWVAASNGDDANPGTFDKPWKTLVRARIDFNGDPKVAYGDTVAVANGSYSQFSIDKNLFPLWEEEYFVPLPVEQKWVRYVAVEDDVRLASIRLSLGNDLRVVAHEFDGFQIIEPSNRAIYGRCVMGLRLKNMTLRGITDTAKLYAETSNHNNMEFVHRNAEIHIDNCDISAGYRGVFFGGWNCNLSITNCNIHGVGTDKIISGGGVNFLIENNQIHGNSLLSSEHPDCIQFYTAANRYLGASADNVTIRGNSLYDHSSQGIWTGGSLLNNVLFENNLIYNTGNYEWRVYGVQTGIFRNNTIVGDAIGNTGIVFYGGVFEDSEGLLEGYPRNSNIACHHNVFATSYSGSSGVLSSHDYNLFVRAWSGSPGDIEPNSVRFETIPEATNALFVDPANRDYRLKGAYTGRGGYERIEP